MTSLSLGNESSISVQHGFHYSGLHRPCLSYDPYVETCLPLWPMGAKQVSTNAVTSSRMSVTGPRTEFGNLPSLKAGDIK